MADDFKYHIDHAGGLVRPAALLAARRGRAFDASGGLGGTTPEANTARVDEAELAKVTDEAIAEVARVQRRIGLSAISDGQYRRANPGYALAISRAGRDRLTAHGIDPDGLLDRMATADRASIEALDTDEEFRVSLDITTGGVADLTGGYDADAVARFFSRLPFYRVQVEHTAGADFPLGSVPSGRVLALGVVDVRAAAHPPVEDLLDRVDAVTAILDVDDIAISTNGSFAPVADAPGQLSWAEQVDRLQLVEMVARYYWGNEL